MTRTTRVLSEKDRLPDAWITVEGGAVVSICARNGNHFRVLLTLNATLEPPYEPHSGQEIILRVEQDDVGGWDLTPNSTLVFRNGETTLGINTTANAVTFLTLRYDDVAQAWDVATGLSRARADALYAAIGSGAPTDAEYLVGAASGGLSAERVVTDTATITWDLSTPGQAKANLADISGTYLTVATAAASYQPLDADLTAIAALATDAFGRGFLTRTNEATSRTYIGATAAGSALFTGANAAAQRTSLELGTAYAANIAAAQADSTAILVSDLVTDFNALLAKLRAAGLMAT